MKEKLDTRLKSIETEINNLQTAINNGTMTLHQLYGKREEVLSLLKDLDSEPCEKQD